MSQKRIWTENDLCDIIKLYTEQGLTLKEIGMKYATKSNKISAILKEKNIPIKRKGSAINRVLNDRYFDEINTEDKAYFLGLMLTDGSVVLDTHGRRSPQISLELIETDVAVLNLFKEKLNIQSNLYYNKRKNRTHGTYCLAVRSQQLADGLIKHKIIPNKTYLLTELPEIKLALLPHFLRGIVDGDGSIYKSGGYWHLSIVNHSQMILEEIKNAINSLCGISKTLKISHCETVPRLTYNGKDVNSILNILYPVGTKYTITRKYLLANQVFKEYK